MSFKPTCTSAREDGFGGQAWGREFVDVGKLVFALDKVVRLDWAFDNVGLEAVGELADAHAQLLSNVS